MGSSVTRNALKGYTYQDYIYLLFVAIMDANREIKSIDVEGEVQHNFDDIILTVGNGTQYFIQVKNNDNISMEDVTVARDCVSLRGVKIKKPEEKQKSVIVIKAEEDESCRDILFGINVKKIEGSIVLPLTTDNIERILEGLYQSDKRLLQIIKFTKARIIKGVFFLLEEELPNIETFSTKLEDELVRLREAITLQENELLWCIGKPGVGKSYFAAELEQEYPDMVLYRFWTHSQDENKARRLLFNEFIIDIGNKFFKSAKTVSVDDIVNKIIVSEKLFVIDGLDHVQNYAPNEFAEYMSFIGRIKTSKTIILTRPLREVVCQNSITIGNWNRKQSDTFLKEKYDFSYGVLHDIYEVAEGYPIITKFLAEHYQNTNSLNIKEKINSLDEYYEYLIKEVKTKPALSIFLITDRFITDKEIEDFLDTLSARIIYDFIRDYPYLFEVRSNRIALIHDSLNTYLKNQEILDEKQLKKIHTIVKKSIVNKEIQYMSRMNAFDLQADDKSEIYSLYADFAVFKEVLNNNYDFESVKEFYESMKSDLRNHPNVLDVYQYYAFILICSIVERNDFVGMEVLVKNHIDYLLKQGIHSSDIYSSGILWYGFLAYENKSLKEFAPWVDRLNYSNNTIDMIDFNYEMEELFFDCVSRTFDYDKFFNYLRSNANESSYYAYEAKQSYISGFLVNIYLFGCRNKDLENNTKKYIDKECEKAAEYIVEFFEVYINNEYIAREIPFLFKQRLMQVGKKEADNIYKSTDVSRLISQMAHKGSWKTAETLQGCLRLNNYLNVQVDITEIWKVYFMYYYRKDYTVTSLPEALITFEKVKRIQEKNSIKIISFVMGQSEKGIRHLLKNYTDMKEDVFVLRAQCSTDYMECNAFHILDMSPSKLNLVDELYVLEAFYNLTDYHRTTKQIEHRDIQNIIASKYRKLVIGDLIKYGYEVINIPQKEEKNFINIKVDYSIRNDESINIRKPFENGYVKDEDIDYIRDYGLSAVEVAKFPDGWHRCLPYLEVFENYDDTIIKRDILKIIHESMYTNIPDSKYIGYWHNYLGYLPSLLLQKNYPVDWERLYKVFEEFLECSSIYYKE